MNGSQVDNPSALALMAADVAVLFLVHCIGWFALASLESINERRTPWPQGEMKDMSPSILGRKVGMTQVYLEDGRVVPVTVIQAGPCHVLQVRNQDA